MNIRTVGVICGVLSGFFWGTMDIASQYLLHTAKLTPAPFISLTMLLSTVLLFAAALVRSPQETFAVLKSPRNIGQMMIFGLLLLLTEVSFYVCVKYSNAETAAVIAATRPFCIMGLLIFASVRPTVSQILCCGLALAGVSLLATKGNFSAISLHWLPVLIGLGAPLFSAGYTLQSRAIVRMVGPLISMAWAMLFASVLSNIYFPFWQVKLDWTFLTVLSVFWVAVMGHIVAYMLYIISAGKILPTITGVLETVEPLTAILLSWLLFSQKMNTPMLIGASMILAAVVFLGFVGSKRNFQ